MSDDDRAAWAARLYADDPYRGWLDIGIRCGYTGNTTTEALYAVYRAGRRLIPESAIKKMPTTAWRKRARAWNEELRATYAAWIERDLPPAARDRANT